MEISLVVTLGIKTCNRTNVVKVKLAFDDGLLIVLIRELSYFHPTQAERNFKIRIDAREDQYTNDTLVMSLVSHELYGFLLHFDSSNASNGDCFLLLPSGGSNRSEYNAKSFRSDKIRRTSRADTVKKSSYFRKQSYCR